jgi:type VI secretion system protein ImpE
MAGMELLKTGPLSEAIQQVADGVRQKPADLAARTFYFELLCVNGDLDRAAKQLDVLSIANPELGVSIYHGALRAERERRSFFHGGPRPRMLGQSTYASAHLEAVEHYAAGSFSAAANLLQDSAEERASVIATLNGEQVTGIGDSSDLLGPFLEVIMDGHYAWIPWDDIRSLGVPEPRYLRDTVWSPVSLELVSGGHGEALVFSLYVDSQLQADALKLWH